MQLLAIFKSDLKECFRKWEDCWKKFVASKGKYFEENSIVSENTYQFNFNSNNKLVKFLFQISLEKPVQNLSTEMSHKTRKRAINSHE